jgi:hypothetical protein
MKYCKTKQLHKLIQRGFHIQLWFHGHTHYSDIRTVGNTIVISNQCGYKGEKEANEKFNANLVIALKI